MSAWPDYSELHVLSDLHLGGEGRERQIFNQGDVFAGMVEGLLRKPTSARQALLINGDLVDFLAEPEPTYFDPVNAPAKLDRIMRDGSFEMVWMALRSFVKAADRTLIIALGNHDLELALPWVRAQLLQELSGGDSAARSRIVLAFEEGGYRCRVGGADVLCVHGNEVDPWNATDYEQLRRIGQSALYGAPLREWTPNGGTKLVIDVMNEIKHEYPFIDLLKPEEEAAIPVLIALRPELIPKIAEAFPAWLRSRWDQLRIWTGMLTGQELPFETALGDAGTPVTMLGEMLGEVFGNGARARMGEDSNELLRPTEEQFRVGMKPLDLLSPAQRSAYVGMVGAIWSLIRRKGAAEVLRQALDRLHRDRSFHLRAADDTFRKLDRRMSPDINFLVAGHTHLERALPRGNGGYYYNSGTWVRLIQLTSEILASKLDFHATYCALKTGKMDVLDNEPALVLHRPTVVSFGTDTLGAFGVLQHVAGDQLVPDERSRHFIKLP